MYSLLSFSTQGSTLSYCVAINKIKIIMERKQAQTAQVKLESIESELELESTARREQSRSVMDREGTPDLKQVRDSRRDN